MAKLKKSDVKKYANLANLKIDPKEQAYFANQFNETLEIIEQFEKLDTSKVGETSQVTGLVNVFRRDVIEAGKILPQREALANARKTHNGYFVTDAVFNEK